MIKVRTPQDDYAGFWQLTFQTRGRFSVRTVRALTTTFGQGLDLGQCQMLAEREISRYLMDDLVLADEPLFDWVALPT